MSATEKGRGTNDSDMSKYVLNRAALGTVIGGSISTGLVTGLYYKTPWFKKFTNASARAFLAFAGAGIGFSLASDWAAVHFYRYMDRPELSGFKKLSEEEQEMIKNKQKNEILKSWAWDNRFKLIGAAWATTLGGFLYRSYSNPYASAVQKFGSARIAAQFVTLGSLIAVFAFNSETSPFFGKQPRHER